ncbi:MAG: T9SS type A sorting domain-containing protein [Bacteroidales bacterium]|nr:T9SS type A sorting domain-containing protein [Bacteroidales bacterium]
MKTLLFTILSFFCIVAVQGQQIARDKVIVEIGTGTWCYYCPGSALGADDLISNGKEVAVIEHHGPAGSDPFATTGSVARNTFYGITGYPTAWFDGGNAVVGGSHTASMYSNYLSKYNQRIAVPCSFSLEMNGFNSGLDYTVIVSAEQVASYGGAGVTLHLVLTESDIIYSWQGLSELHFVNRLMVPNQNGTSVVFAGINDVVSTQLTFSLDPSWVPEHCELVAFLQDNANREILQGMKVSLTDLLPTSFNNATCQAVSMVPVTNCEGQLAPVVSISNDGAETLESLDINYQVNEETINTFNWSGSLAFGQSTDIELPVVSFDILNENNLVVYTTNPNGNPDEDPMNDTTSTSFMAAQQVIPDIYLFLKLDDNPEETTYKLMNSNGDVIYSGGPFTTPQAFVKDTFELSMNDCYTFTINDAGGNGLQSGSYYALRESNFNMIYENDAFSDADEMVQFDAVAVGVEEITNASELMVFPNPATDVINVKFEVSNSEPVEITLYNLVGEIVYTSGVQSYPMGAKTKSINVENNPSGVYFLRLKIGDQLFTQKISVTK